MPTRRPKESGERQRQARGIALLRVVRGWTMTELAQRAGVGTSTVSNLENGSVEPEPATVGKLLEALELPPVALEDAMDFVDWVDAARGQRGEWRRLLGMRGRSREEPGAGRLNPAHLRAAAAVRDAVAGAVLKALEEEAVGPGKSQ